MVQAGYRACGVGCAVVGRRVRAGVRLGKLVGRREVDPTKPTSKTMTQRGHPRSYINKTLSHSKTLEWLKVFLKLSALLRYASRRI